MIMKIYIMPYWRKAQVTLQWLLSRQVIDADMEEFMENLKTKCSVGIVGGSDIIKIAEQMKGMRLIYKTVKNLN